MNDEILKKLEIIERNTLLAAKNVLTLDDVALLTGLSKSWLYKSKDIPKYKPNNKITYYDRVELEKWMKQNRIATTEEIDHEAARYLTRKGAKR